MFSRSVIDNYRVTSECGASLTVVNYAPRVVKYAPYIFYNTGHWLTFNAIKSPLPSYCLYLEPCLLIHQHFTLVTFSLLINALAHVQNNSVSLIK
jgi:hypothetical protein